MKAPRLLPQLKRNVGTIERIASIALGSYLIYRAFSGENRAVKAVAGSLFLFRGATAHCPTYDVLNVNTATPPNPLHIESTITVNKSPREVYDFWRRLENLPLFMKHLQSVTSIDDNLSEWKAKIPGGMGTIDWESRIVNDMPEELVEWESINDAPIQNKGKVSFKDAGESGTEVHFQMSYVAPGGYLGYGIGKLLSPATEAMIRKEIQNFKSLIEAGETSATEE